MLYILDSMEEIKMRLLTDDYGKHLMGVEDLLQKHALVEADINVLGERVKVKSNSSIYSVDLLVGTNMILINISRIKSKILNF